MTESVLTPTVAAPSAPYAPANVQAKAARYLLGGAVQVNYADAAAGIFDAEVQGSAAHPYHVAYFAEAWHCLCPATRTCAHIIACSAIFTPRAAR